MKDLKIEFVDIEKIIPNDYNPKSMTEEEEFQLTQSIKKFGLVEPLVLNSAENRKNVLIGGHQRLKILQKLGFKKVPVVYVEIADIEKEKELCLRLSKNVGSWDLPKLRLLEPELLRTSGFSDFELIEFQILPPKLDFVPAKIEIDEKRGIKAKEIVCPNCGTHVSIK